MGDVSDVASSNQEQAVAAWIGHLNQLRLDTLFSRLAAQDEHLGDALSSIDSSIRKIDLEVVSRNRGGVKGMHGFIAEVAEVGIGNARRLVVGDGSAYEWVNDNGPSTCCGRASRYSRSSSRPAVVSGSAPSPIT